MINQTQFLHVIEQAVRAPSVHNTQAFRFKLDGEQFIEVWGDSDRILHVGDARLKDHLVSAGASLEGIRIALSGVGFGLHREVESFSPDKSQKLHKIARARIVSSESVDPLSPFVMTRKSFRGRFLPVPSNVLPSLQSDLDSLGDNRCIIEREDIAKSADLYNCANGTFVKNRDYANELIHWLRLSKKHPQFHRDGLNSDCLALSRFERLAARVIFSPKLFHQIVNLPFGLELISEGPQIKSSSFLLALFYRKNESLLDVGSRFYRTWLTLAAHGVSACPLSGLADHYESSERFMRDILRIDSSAQQSLLNVFRCGNADVNIVATSPRLDVQEFILHD